MIVHLFLLLNQQCLMQKKKKKRKEKSCEIYLFLLVSSRQK